MDNAYVQCKRCILDTNDSQNISFNELGLCENCQNFDIAWESIPKEKRESTRLINELVERIKNEGVGKKYDCIIGLSGGVDSSYIAMLIKKLGLRPLAVHFDNGWNSELAVKNIEKIVSTLDIDLYTYVINWDDFKKLQLAYFQASVVDIEVLTDHAIYGALYKISANENIKFIISGVNVATESVLPDDWIYNKLDDINIKSIFREFGSGEIKTYPFVDKKARREIEKSGVEIVHLLNMMDFNVKKAKDEIKQNLGWVSYGGKHFESIFTRFYQGYILPRKFGIDKRKAHLSNLICSNQMTKEEALAEISFSNYTDLQIYEDRVFVLKKLGLSNEEFDLIMSQPVRRHQEFDMQGSFFGKYPFLKVFQPTWRKVKRNYIDRKIKQEF